MNTFSKIIATGCFLGYFPFAPGTAGSLLSVLIYWIMPQQNHWWSWSLILIPLFFLGVITSTKAEKVLGRDSPRIVIDEIWGFQTSVAFLPKAPFVIALGFLFFRTLDVFKPPPASLSQKIPRGWGVMADDLFSGIYTNLIIRIILLTKTGGIT